MLVLGLTGKTGSLVWYEHLLVPTFLRVSPKDKAALQQEVSASALEFVIARPPLMKDDPPAGSLILIMRPHAHDASGLGGNILKNT